MRKPAKVLAAILLAAGIFSAGYMANRQHGPVAATGSAKQAPTYSCPMHPQYTSDRQGDCPICGMRLEPVAAGDAGDVGLGESRHSGDGRRGRRQATADRRPHG